MTGGDALQINRSYHLSPISRLSSNGFQDRLIFALTDMSGSGYHRRHIRESEYDSKGGLKWKARTKRSGAGAGFESAPGNQREDVEQSIEFYRKLFGIEPSKVRTGYAKFDVQNPPLNFTLNEGRLTVAEPCRILGFRCDRPKTCWQPGSRWNEAGLLTRDEMQTDCCYATQDKTWVRDPDGNEWEVFVVLKDNLAETAPCECRTDETFRPMRIRKLSFLLRAGAGGNREVSLARLRRGSSGTAFLLAAVVGSGIMAERLAGGNVAMALLANTIATGAALVALILTFGPISGAHLNPVVTLSFALQSGIAWRESTAYIVAQFAGAVAGVVTANLMFGLPPIFFSSQCENGSGAIFQRVCGDLWPGSRRDSICAKFSRG